MNIISLPSYSTIRLHTILCFLVIQGSLFGCSNSTSHEEDETQQSQSAFNQQTVFFTPDTQQQTLIDRKVAHLTVGERTLYIGTHQISDHNQNPIIVAFQDGVKVWTFTEYETAPPDGTGLGLATDGTSVWAVFTVDGGSNDSPFFTDYTSNGWISSYGRGGGPKVSVILQISPENGVPTGSGTFLISKLSNGNTNSLQITNVLIEENVIEISANAWFSPLDIEKNPLSVSGSSPFFYTVRLTRTLEKALSTLVE